MIFWAMAPADPTLSVHRSSHGLKKAAKHIGNMTLVIEDIARSENRITLSDSTDRDGIPLAHTYHDLSADLINRWDQRMAEGQAIFRAAGGN